MSISMEAEKTTKKKSETHQSAANTEGGSEAATKAATGTNARTWLDSLSAEESAAAMSFRDGPFIASFLHFSAASQHQHRQPQPRQTPVALLLNTHAFDIRELTMSVDEKEWEKALSQHRGAAHASSSETEVATTTATATTTAAAGTSAGNVVPAKANGSDASKIVVVEGFAMSGAKSADCVEKEAEVFRIPSDSEHGKGGAAGTAVAEATATATDGGSAAVITSKGRSTSSKSKTRKAGKTSHKGDAKEVKVGEKLSAPPDGVEETAMKVVENVCLVFPSAAALGSSELGQAADGGAPVDIPFVTLQPRFVRGKGTENCVRLLDNVMKVMNPSSGFLSNDFLPQDWLAVDEMDDENDKNSPKKVSITAAEKLCVRRLQSLMDGTAPHKKSPAFLFLVLLIRIEVAVYLAFRDIEVGTEEVSRQERLDPKDLEKRVAALDNLSRSVNVAKLKRILAPLIEGGYCSFETGAVGAGASGETIQNLLLAPLPDVVEMLSSATLADPSSFRSWRKAWNSTIQNLLELSKKVSGAGVSKANASARRTPNSPVKADASPKPSAVKGMIEPTTYANINAPALASSDRPDETATSASATAPSSNSKKKKRRNKKKKKNKNNRTGNNAEASPPPLDSASASAVDVEEVEATVVVAATTKETRKSEILSTKGDAGNEQPAEPKKETHNVTSMPAEDAAEQGSVGDGETTETPGEVDDKAEAETEIGPSKSFESGKLPLSTSDETASTRSESTKHDEAEAESDAKISQKNDFTVSRVHGVGTVVVAPSTAEAPTTNVVETEQPSSKTSSASPDEGCNNNPNDEDEWETVEVKGRSNRKKGGRAMSQQASSLSSSSNSAHAGCGNKKSKATRTRASRNRGVVRKMAKEIIASVLDSVDEEVRRRRQQETRTTKSVHQSGQAPVPVKTQSAWKEGSRRPGLLQTGGSKREQTGGSKREQSGGSKKEATMRDVVLGRQPGTPPPKPASTTKPKQSTPQAASATQPNTGNGGNFSPSKGSKGHGSGADQNTAPTIPETVSAVSDPRRVAPSTALDITRSDSSSTDTDDIRKQDRASVPTHTNKTSSPEPPLPTLLNPGNVTSASSSVASSLEAPHASHGHHHTSSHGHHHASSSNEIDVGYHLLDVCDRLTRDMHAFMARRASALNTRRMERGALLGALQDSVSSIWAGHSHVELYGSCATMLDLPSSDLDVVVCGLDHMEAAMNASPSPRESMPAYGRSNTDNLTPDTAATDPQIPHRHSMPQFPPLQLNAERVLRLAADLEHQPWAVHVKAIPTASVPVVKVLADPSRLPGAVPANFVDGEDWMLQHHYAANAGTMAPVSAHNEMSPMNDPGQYDGQYDGSHYHATVAQQPVWRGADVINGLIKLDITFEGPEHGGIGSTEFSARAVQNISEEMGLAAESTAFVQVIMVVKELLAQRRLNEPFSGGLSSYALLLLVLAVMCERKVVREELDRVEKQRQAVAYGGGNPDLQIAATENRPEMTQEQAHVETAVDRSTKQQEDKCLNKTTGDDHAMQLAPTQKPPAAAQTSDDAAQPGKKATQSGEAHTQKSTGHTQKNIRGTVSPSSTKAAKNNRTPWQAEGSVQGTTKTQVPLKKGVAGGNGGASPRHVETGTAKKSPSNSWASIAMGKSNGAVTMATTGEQKQEQQAKKQPPQSSKPTSFAEAVARNAGGAAKGRAVSATSPMASIEAVATAQPKQGQVTVTSVTSANNGGTNTEQTSTTRVTPSPGSEKVQNVSPIQATKSPDHTSTKKEKKREAVATQTNNNETERKLEADEKTSKFNNYSAETAESAISSTPSAFPQGFNDVIEVLCSGETTPGKLLMHFFLFYGQHFDAHATAIDISGKHEREFTIQNPPYAHLSPYIQRRSAGTIDPITGMLTVDPIVVYDPLEGAENNNVARRCFLWSSVKWVFAQSYMTLSSAVERNTTPPGTPVADARNVADGTESNALGTHAADASGDSGWRGPYNASDKGGLFDPSSPLLELLLSF